MLSGQRDAQQLANNALTIDREIDEVKDQVKREIATIRELMDSFGYASSAPGWNAPFQVHRLRRALRIHYLALKIRDSAPVPNSINELMWTLDQGPDMP